MKLVQVAAAVIVRQGEVCLARRPDHLHQGGKWEFPGGKIESEETLDQAIHRELHEELNIQVNSSEPLITITHHYSDKSVCLNVVWVENFVGEPEGMEGQEVRWVPLQELTQYEFPDANVPIVTAAQLPRSYVITPQLTGSVDQFVGALEKVIELGHRLIQIRTQTISESDWMCLTDHLAQLKKRFPVCLIKNSAAPYSNADVFDGIHLTSHDLNNLNEKPREYKWVSASCHNQQELQLAQQLGVDFVTLSPFAVTSSHPEQSPLGERHFAELVKAAKIPVYALGGVGEPDLNRIIDLGAQGVAGISGFWPASD